MNPTYTGGGLPNVIIAILILMGGFGLTYIGGNRSNIIIVILTLAGLQPYIHWWWLVKHSNSHTYTGGGFSPMYTGGGLSKY